MGSTPNHPVGMVSIVDKSPSSQVANKPDRSHRVRSIDSENPHEAQYVMFCTKMLGLEAETKHEWVEAVLSDTQTLMLDHAHCELKAAQNAMSLATKFGSTFPDMVAPFSELAAEELEHFALVIRRLQEQGLQYCAPESNSYVKRLRAALWPRGVKIGDVPELLDRLLLASMIEARSCERFQMLSRTLPVADMRNFYHSLMRSEARHHRLFRGFAERYFGLLETRKRWQTLANLEARIISSCPPQPLMHG